jgi:hypothetical protein
MRTEPLRLNAATAVTTPVSASLGSRVFFYWPMARPAELALVAIGETSLRAQRVDGQATDIDIRWPGAV